MLRWRSFLIFKLSKLFQSQNTWNSLSVGSLYRTYRGFELTETKIKKVEEIKSVIQQSRCTAILKWIHCVNQSTERNQFCRFCYVFSLGQFGDDTLTIREPKYISFTFRTREPNCLKTRVFGNRGSTVIGCNFLSTYITTTLFWSQ